MRRVVLLLTTAMLACGVAWASGGRQLSDQQVQSLLARLQAVRQTVTLQGRMITTVRLASGLVRSEALIRRGPGALQIEYLTGRFRGWKVIVQDGSSWRLSPQGKASPMPGGGDPSFPMLPRKMRLNVQAAGAIQMAGRKVNLYRIQPPSDTQTLLIIGLDAKSGYPLRMERYAADGQLLSSTTYLSINYQVSPPAKLPVPSVASSRGGGPQKNGGSRPQAASEAELARSLGGDLLKPSYLPQGFSFRGAFSHRRPPGLVAELRYGDGLRVLSIFEWAKPRSGGSNCDRASITRGPRGYIWRQRQGGLVVAVSADLSEDEITRVGQSLR